MVLCRLYDHCQSFECADPPLVFVFGGIASVVAYLSAFIAYLFLSFLVFGDPVMPIFGIGYLPIYITAPSLGAGIGLAKFSVRRLTRNFLLPEAVGPTIFVIVGFLSSLAIAGVVAQTIRHFEIRRMEPDEVSARWFGSSLQIAGREHAFAYHAVLLKNCVVYNWSYRLMTFYEMTNDNITVNHAPNAWVKKCGIKRH